MEQNFRSALVEVLKHEGGWADHPSDPGGATMKGVTKGRYEEYLGRKVTKSELKRIPDKHVEDIYKSGYWDRCRCDELPHGVDFAVFDGAVNSGPSRSAKWLQRAVLVDADGAIGQITMDAVWKLEPEVIIERICDDRLNFLRRLRTWQVFGRGWSRRVKSVRMYAINLSRRHGSAPPPISRELANPIWEWIGLLIVAIVGVVLKVMGVY